MAKTSNFSVTKPMGSSACYAAGQSQGSWFSQHRGIAIATTLAAVAVVFFALSQHWLAAAALLPLLYILPCAVMMSMCMRGTNYGQQTNTAQAPAQNETTTNAS